MSPPVHPLLGRAWREGDRVEVIAKEAPGCRSGSIETITAGGALVRHDEGEHMGLFGYRDLFGWGWTEIEPEGQ